MKKQEKTRKENQRSEILGNDSTTRENKRFILTRMNAIANTLLVQNTIKGPPGRSRSPGTEAIHTTTDQTKLLFMKEFIFMHLQQLNKLNINVLSTF